MCLSILTTDYKSPSAPPSYVSPSSSTKPADMPPPAKRRISVGNWLLKNNMLVPKKDLLLTHCTYLSAQPPPDDPLITFRFPCSSSSAADVLIHKSRLTLIGGPLSALVNAGFVESNQRLIRLSEEDSFTSFRVIRKFLYCQQINMLTELRIDMVLIAHRWQLTDLFNAFFLHAEQHACIRDAVDIFRFFPLMCKIQLPSHFKSYLSIQVAHHITDLLYLIGLRTPATQSSPKKRFKCTEQPSSKRQKQECNSTPTQNPSSAGKAPSKPTNTLDDIAEAAHVQAHNRLQSHLPKIRAEYATFSMSIWQMFHSQDMFAHVIHYISRFAAPDYAALFLDVILRELEPILSDDEISSLLRQLDWESVRRSDALSEETTSKWSVRALRLLSVAQSELLARGVSELRMRWKFGYLLQAIAEHEGGNFSATSANFPFEDHHFNMSASCTDCNPNYMGPFIVRINLVRGKGDGRWTFDNRPVSVRVRAIEAGCGCERSNSEFNRKSFRGFQARRMHGSDNDSVSIAAFGGRGGVPFVLLQGSEFGKWLTCHQPSCGLVVQAVLRFGQPSNGKDGLDACGNDNVGKEAPHRDDNRFYVQRGPSRRPLCSCGLRHTTGGEQIEDDDEDVDDHDSDGSDVEVILNPSGMSWEDGIDI